MAVPKVRLETVVSPTKIPVSDDPYAVSVAVHIIAPGVDEGVQIRPLNLGLLLDKSGSMAGNKMDTAKAAARRVVETLNEDDIFTLITFGETYQVDVPATRIGSNRSAILDRINNIVPDGRTFLEGAIEAAGQQMRPFCGDQRVSAIYVLTDGQVHDAPMVLAKLPAISASRISVRAGGIGPEYVHNFLDQICSDPVQTNKSYLVEHIELSNLTEQLTTNFEEFLKTKGHVVTANSQLVVEVAPARATIKMACSADQNAQLVFDGSNAARVADLPAGGHSIYLFQFVVHRRVAGDLEVARIRLNYQIGNEHVSVPAAAMVSILNDQSLDPTPDKAVVSLFNHVHAAIAQERAVERQMAGDKRGSTQLLRRSTQLLKDLGRFEDAEIVEQQIKDIESGQIEDDLLIKRAREAGRRTSRLKTDRLDGHSEPSAD